MNLFAEKILPKQIFILLLLLTSGVSLNAQQVDSLKPKPTERSIAIPFPKSLGETWNAPYEVDPLPQKIDYPLLIGASAITVAAGVTVHMIQYNAWWRTQDAEFRIINDWHYARWVDKVGHFYGTNVLAHSFTSAMEAANFQTRESYIYGSALAFAFQMYVEIEDGFGPQWGFSPGDALFDFLGAAYHLGQYYYPVLHNFQPRWSYIPSEKMKNGQHEGNFIDDYEGQIYWIGMRMNNILPSSWAEYWPSFLMISAGMGVSNLDGSGGGSNEFYLALDLDWEEIIPLHGKFWNFIKNTLNYFHFPMPGIRISPNAAAFIIVF